DRCGEERSEDAAVCDCKRTAGKVGQCKLLVTCLCCKVCNVFFDLSEVLAVCITNYRDDKAFFGGNRDAYIKVVFQQKISAVELGVHVRVLLECSDDCFREERHEAEACAELLLELVFFAL